MDEAVTHYTAGIGVWQWASCNQNAGQDMPEIRNWKWKNVTEPITRT